MLLLSTLLLSTLMAPTPQDPTSHSFDVMPRHTDLSRKLAQMASEHPLVVAHRGDPIGFPENTLAAFQGALDQGSDMVELDFRQTADGQLVVIHDRTVDRTTDSRARLGEKDVDVSSLSLAKLATLDAGSWKDARHEGQSIPTLDAALDLIQASAITMIEHKSGDADTLIALLRNKSLLEHVIVQSFDWKWLREIHQAEPRITIAALGKGAINPKKLAELEGTGACMLHWRYEDLSPESIDMLKATGHLLCSYTVNADLSLVGATAMGLDAITTNRPSRLRALIASGKARRY